MITEITTNEEYQTLKKTLQENRIALHSVIRPESYAKELFYNFSKTEGFKNRLKSKLQEFFGDVNLNNCVVTINVENESTELIFLFGSYAKVHLATNPDGKCLNNESSVLVVSPPTYTTNYGEFRYEYVEQVREFNNFMLKACELQQTNFGNGEIENFITDEYNKVLKDNETAIADNSKKYSKIMQNIENCENLLHVAKYKKGCCIQLYSHNRNRLCGVYQTLEDVHKGKRTPAKCIKEQDKKPVSTLDLEKLYKQTDNPRYYVKVVGFNMV